MPSKVCLCEETDAVLLARPALDTTIGVAGSTAVSLAIPAGAAERHVMQPLVPTDKLAEVRALTSPSPSSQEIVEQGKALYNGKGACFNCHGKDGDGNGPLAVQLNPSPRNFQHHGFWRHRTEGEIFWVIKNGSVGTSMIGFGGQLTDEEIWGIIQYVRSFAGEHGRGMMGHGQGMGPMMGSGCGMGGMERGGSRGGMGGCEGEACGREPGMGTKRTRRNGDIPIAQA